MGVFNFKWRRSKKKGDDKGPRDSEAQRSGKLNFEHGNDEDGVNTVPASSPPREPSSPPGEASSPPTASSPPAKPSSPPAASSPPGEASSPPAKPSTPPTASSPSGKASSSPASPPSEESDEAATSPKSDAPTAPPTQPKKPSEEQELDEDGLGEVRKIDAGDEPLKIAIMNGKGGSGKSTIATNLASILSSHANSVTIIDNDPQASSIRWLRERPDSALSIKGVNATKLTGLRNVKMWSTSIGSETKYVIVDTQAGLKGGELSEIIERCDIIVIPVLPSAMDMRATADFVAQIFLSVGYRKTKKPIGVVANRVINDSYVYRKLQKFLLSLRMNFISTFSDNRAYLIAAETGLGIFEGIDDISTEETTGWKLLTNWIKEKEKLKYGGKAK